jgi:hypothetical protein
LINQCAGAAGYQDFGRRLKQPAHMIYKNKRANHPLPLEREQAANHKVTNIARALFNNEVNV